MINSITIFMILCYVTNRFFSCKYADIMERGEGSRHPLISSVHRRYDTEQEQALAQRMAQLHEADPTLLIISLDEQPAVAALDDDDGGPYITSLLPNFKDHISRSIWDATIVSIYNAINFYVLFKYFILQYYLFILFEISML